MRNALARTLIGFATLAGTVAFTAYLLLATTLNPHRVGDVAAALLQDPSGRATVADVVSSGVERTAGQPLSSAQRSQLAALLSDKKVQDALRKTTISEREGFDFSPLLKTMASRERIAGHPALARQLRTASRYKADLPAPALSTYTRVRGAAQRARDIGATVATGAAVLALLTATKRRWVLRRLGWATLGVVGASVVLYLVVPHLLARLVGDNIGSAILTALGVDVVAPLVAVAAAGASLVAISYVPAPGPGRQLSAAHR